MLLLGFCPSAQYNGPFELANWGKRDLTTARVGISPFIIIVIIIIIIIVIFIIIITIIIIVIIIITIIIIIIFVITELTHSKTILENAVEIEPQPVALEFKNLSQCSSCSKQNCLLKLWCSCCNTNLLQSIAKLFGYST